MSAAFLASFATHQAPTLFAAEPRVIEADVIVYGGTSGGVVAAVAARRAGKIAVIVEPGRHLGGMTSGGLSWTDIGSKPEYVRAVGGIAREFYRRVGSHYGMQPGTEFDVPTSNDPTRTGADFAKPPSLSFEPKIAETVFTELLKEAEVTAHFDSPLAKVTKEGSRLRELVTTDGHIFRGRVFIDASYEGDLLAAAGVSSTIGREANSKYGETANGTQGPATNPAPASSRCRSIHSARRVIPRVVRFLTYCKLAASVSSRSRQSRPELQLPRHTHGPPPETVGQSNHSLITTRQITNCSLGGSPRPNRPAKKSHCGAF